MHAYFKRKLSCKYITLFVCVLILPVISCTNLVDDIFEEQASETVAESPLPVSTLTDSKTGRIAIYAGGADTVTELLFTDIDTVVDYILKYER